MAVSKAQQKSVRRYIKSHYDRQDLTMPKGKKQMIKELAEKRGESVNAYINRAIDEMIARDQM